VAVFNSVIADDQGANAAYWDSVIASWEPTLAHRLWRAHSDAVNRRVLRGWLPSGTGTVLKTDLFDEAVGSGLVPELAERSAEVIGIDVSPVVVRAASERYPDLDARVASVLALPFADASFDAVVSNSTLDHFDSHSVIRSAVHELKRLIRPGGRLIITLDNRTNPIVALRTSILAGAFRRLGLVPYHVGATHGAWGLTRLLGESDWEAAETMSIMHCPPQLAAWWTARREAPDAADIGRYIRRVLRFEAMARWPTRHLTGHFVAALAIRRS